MQVLVRVSRRDLKPVSGSLQPSHHTHLLDGPAPLLSRQLDAIDGAWPVWPLNRPIALLLSNGSQELGAVPMPFAPRTLEPSNSARVATAPCWQCCRRVDWSVLKSTARWNRQGLLSTTTPLRPTRFCRKVKVGFFNLRSIFWRGAVRELEANAADVRIDGVRSLPAFDVAEENEPNRSSGSETVFR